MKRASLILAAGLVIIAGAVLAVRTHKGPASKPEPYRLTAIADDVSWLRAGTTAPQAVHGTVTVAPGDTVTTSLAGRARMEWPNATVTTLEGNTQVVIRELADSGSKSSIELIFGDMWAKVSRILGTGQYYEVQTQETVAAVRGTVFRVQRRNRHTRVQGVEHAVRVWARDTAGRIDESSATDVDEQTVAELDADLSGPRRLRHHRLTPEELRDPVLQNIRDDAEPSPTPRPSPSPTPRITIKPSLTPLQTPTQTLVPTQTPLPTTTPLPPVRLDSVFPKAIAVGDTFSLEGANFTSGRSTSRIAQVLINGKPAEFNVIVGGTSVFVTPGQLPPGIYDVSVVTTDGETLSLKSALTIR